jgi:plasmid stabilization system protein ParE
MPARKGPEASRNLLAATREAGDRIERDPTSGLPAPRAYPKLAQPGCARVKAQPYWFVYTTGTRADIIAVFHDSTDIPGRFQPLKF